MQKTMIIGNLGKDAEVKSFQNSSFMSFSVGVTETWKDAQGQKQSKTTWYECVKNKNYDGIINYLKKGAKVYVEGKSNAKAYVNKHGEAQAVNNLQVQNIEILSFVEANSNTQPQQHANQFHQQQPMQQHPDDNLPF